jgi:putative transcriptional regulator
MLTIRIALAATLAFAAVLWNGGVMAVDRIDQTVILVATPALRDQIYGASVVIATPIGGGQHIGFILNRPTPVKLGEMFPDHAPSKKVIEPIYLGGPESQEALFAVVQRPGRAGTGKIKLGSDLYLEVERDKVDGVIEKEYRQARFFAGVVVWQRGELRAEVRNDFWYVQDADAELVLRKSTTGMWEELVKRVRQNKNLITTRLAVPRVAYAAQTGTAGE